MHLRNLSLFNLYDEDIFTLINQNYLYNTHCVPGSSLSILCVKVHVIMSRKERMYFIIVLTIYFIIYFIITDEKTKHRMFNGFKGAW